MGIAMSGVLDLKSTRFRCTGRSGQARTQEEVRDYTRSERDYIDTPKNERG